jgi:hypothetical protein
MQASIYQQRSTCRLSFFTGRTMGQSCRFWLPAEGLYRDKKRAAITAAGEADLIETTLSKAINFKAIIGLAEIKRNMT